MVKLNVRGNASRTLSVISLVIYVLSILNPWLREYGTSPLAVFPPIEIKGTFWSFQALVEVFHGQLLPISFLFRFSDFWFNCEIDHLQIFQGWIVVFVFQILTIILGTISVIKSRVEGRPFSLVAAIITSVLSLVFCGQQFARHSRSGRGYSRLNVYLDIGFFLALISVVLWFFSLLIDKLMRRKTV